MPSASAQALDAVTVDAFGTLVELDDSSGRLQAALAERGVERERPIVASAFRAEVRYYLEHKVEGRDAASLARLRTRCASIFLEEAEAGLDPASFVPSFVEALVFRPLEGTEEALVSLRAAGLALACVSDWDIGLAEQLERAGVAHYFSTIVSSAETGAEKPDPGSFELALERLRVSAKRALHIGDSEADEAGAEAAGVAFASLPLATLPGRLGL